ncbi:hypothetical protein [Streptomyces sp. NPDC057616]|uniref:hypothetical protein n=1 Tax=Streptomyces sp. NPDC057616 TaxID=3346183 RepID=UPI003689BD9E
MTPPEGNRDDVVEVLDSNRPGLKERWQALPPRARATVALSTCLVVLALLAGYFLAPHPAAPQPPPVAGLHVRITHIGVPPPGNPYFGLRLRATATSLVAISGSREGYPDLILYVPLPANPLAPGQVRSLYVRAAVCNCWLPRPPSGTPLLYLTLHTSHGERYLAVVPNRGQFERLNRILRRACAN